MDDSFQTCTLSDILWNLNAKLRLSLLQLCDPGSVSITHSFADAVCQLISQLPLHPLGLYIHLGQLRKNNGNTVDKILYTRTLGNNDLNRWECEEEKLKTKTFTQLSEIPNRLCITSKQILHLHNTNQFTFWLQDWNACQVDGLYHLAQFIKNQSNTCHEQQEISCVWQKITHLLFSLAPYLCKLGLEFYIPLFHLPEGISHLFIHFVGMFSSLPLVQLLQLESSYPPGSGYHLIVGQRLVCLILAIFTSWY